MSENPRDTQFQGFAKKVTQELMRSNAADKVDVDRFWDEENIAEVELLLARRAYDLVAHALSNEKLRWYPFEEIEVRDVPDLTTWPDEGKKG